jgi:hypothetical protein
MIGIIIGNMVNGKRQGEGGFRWSNGKSFWGFWEGDKMHGNGRLNEKGKRFMVRYEEDKEVERVRMD